MAAPSRKTVQIVYISDAARREYMTQLNLAAEEFRAAREAKDIAADTLALRRATLLDCIERLKSAVLEGRL